MSDTRTNAEALGASPTIIFFDNRTVLRLASAYGELFDVLSSLEEHDETTAQLRSALEETISRTGACLAIAVGMQVRQLAPPGTAQSELRVLIPKANAS